MRNTTTSIQGLPTDPDLVEKAAQLLGVCGTAKLVFRDFRELGHLSNGGTLVGAQIDLAPDRYVMYATCDYDDLVNKPDVRLVMSEGVQGAPGFTLISVVCIAAEDNWRLFARLVEGERSDPIKELVMRLGIKNIPADGLSVEPARGLEYVRLIATSAVKQLGIKKP
jgi:hypothetical protein